ncbi:MAG: DUF2911 domain-containing protein [Acidobacteria bacterium]|nr:MAG: DUF2911 domain-containing protein [Acidobacteriota bacterium]
MKQMIVLPALALAGTLLATDLAAQPRVSPPAAVEQTVGISKISIHYSRPSVRGRKIFGELVPWGKVWRTGANEATTFEISHDAKINGQPLKAGKYALFTIPNPESWTVIFNTVPDQWGAFNHEPEKDALRIEVKSEKAPHQESLWIGFPAFTADSATVAIHWADVRVSFDVAFDNETILLEAARAAVAAGTDPRAPYTWAQYFYNNDMHLDAALSWAEQAAAASDIYWTHALKARLLAKHGRHADAVAAAEHALTVIDGSPSAEFAARDAERLREEIKGWQGS